LTRELLVEALGEPAASELICDYDADGDGVLTDRDIDSLATRPTRSAEQPCAKQASALSRSSLASVLVEPGLQRAPPISRGLGAVAFFAKRGAFREAALMLRLTANRLPLISPGQAAFVGEQARFVAERRRSSGLELVLLGETHGRPRQRALALYMLAALKEAGSLPTHFIVEQGDYAQPTFDALARWFRAERPSPEKLEREIGRKMEELFALTERTKGLRAHWDGKGANNGVLWSSRGLSVSIVRFLLENDIHLVCIDHYDPDDGMARDRIWRERWSRVRQEREFRFAVGLMGRSHAATRERGVISHLIAAYQAWLADTSSKDHFGLNLVRDGRPVYSISLDPRDRLHDAAVPQR